MGFDAAVAETHVSVLFFVDDKVFKRKKAVRMSFLDFTDPAERRRVCEREVELNRRLAPDVYLGIADLTMPDGTCEPLVVMRRMPDDRRLSRLAAAPATVPDAEACADGVARALVAFHAKADRNEAIAAEGRAGALLARWDDNLAVMAAAEGDVLDAALVDEVTALAHRYVEGRRPLLDARADGGFVVDGHGDLLTDDIYCLPDGPRILDCIEFSDALRHVDVVDDAAFLAMDLESLGAEALARRFLAAYLAESGDDVPTGLVEHYVAYRAGVRCKVACLRAEQGGADRSAAAAHAAALLDLCRRHLLLAIPRLVAVGGLPGTGKTTLADELAARTGWPVLHSDEVRKELAGLDPHTAAPAAYEQGIYGPEHTAATYAALLERAAHEIAMGRSVIVDASWTDGDRRADAAATAGAAAAELAALWCTAPAEVAAGRIAARASAGGDASDASADIAAAMARRSPAWPGAVTVDTTTEVSASVDAALAAIGALGQSAS